jgi:hypothetical protein
MKRIALVFPQGFVAAQDRLWQLDLWRQPFPSTRNAVEANAAERLTLRPGAPPRTR